MRIAYADPPYPGCGHRYPEKADVDVDALVDRLVHDYDGFVLHTSSAALPDVLRAIDHCRRRSSAVPYRIMAWTKPFAAFKRNVSVAYAWEPVIVRAARKPVVSHRVVMRDWISESIALRKGLVGAKPPAVCRWAFEVVGARPEDDLDDLFPGTGTVSLEWAKWCFAVLGEHLPRAKSQ